MAENTKASANNAAHTGIGASVVRVEDGRLVTGRGHYTDDMLPPGMTFAVMVRSPHAHARIRSIDKTAALAAPGVLLVLSGEDVLAAKLRELPCMAFPSAPVGPTYDRALQHILAVGKARHVGDAVAMVVAETFGQAKDAADLIEVDYEPLPAVTLADALAPHAEKIWDDAPNTLGNCSFRLERGNALAVAEGFARAAHVTKLFTQYPRASANSIEPRAAIAYGDPIDGRITLCSTTQIPFQVREVVAHALGLPETGLRVVAMDVGGGFGMKAQIYPEEVLVVWAANTLKRPVKWRGERSEGIAADQHGRHQIIEAEMAFDANGHALAMKAAVTVDLGAYLGNAAGVPPLNAAICYTSTYDIPQIHATVQAALTNTSPVGPYRGSGKPEANYVTERLIDKAAREMGIDVVEMRRRNLIPSSAMPYQTPGGYVFDSGDFRAALDRALELADWKGFAARRAESERRGLKRGIGIGMHCQRAGSLSERMEIRFAQSGVVSLHVATVSTGQGHETSFGQMISDWLGVPMEKVRLFQGDTDKLLYGRGTFAQRSMIAGGSALKLAAEEVIRKAKRIAGWMLETAESDIEFERGVFRVIGTDREVSLETIAAKSFMAPGLPPAFGIGLDGVGSHPGPNTFPNGCMICEVEVDPDTGNTKVVSLASIDDVGVVINPITLEGQLHGSIAQGLGPALFEEVVYERETGQLLSGSFQDYAMPRADDMPPMKSGVSLVPTKTNLLGVKGGSEAGNVGAPPAIINAIVDALASFGVTDMPMPATPERVWRAIHDPASRIERVR